jgi:hypothetical protein
VYCFAAHPSPCPFNLTQIDAEEGRWQRLRDGGFQRAIGWEIRDELLCNTECGKAIDHMLLGQLCLLWAEHFGGIVRFWGPPEVLGENGTEEPGRAFQSLTAELPGRLIRLHYLIDGEDAGASTFLCDTEFLRAWLGHSNFRMSK